MNTQRVEYASRVEKWKVFELSIDGPSDGNPFTDVELRADFSACGTSISVVASGFYDGGGVYKIRFMPGHEGRWDFVTSSNRVELDGHRGSFVCERAAPGAHGPVRVARGYHFAHEDGTRYLPFGTTCYAWTHQPDALQELTLTTLATSPFNKLRFCVFPKHYDYNRDEPELFPFEGSPEKGWDFTAFKPAFFGKLEKRIGDLLDLGIEADLILFHPYDHWGFSTMGQEADERYLRYIVARLCAYPNLWWSLANEYDLIKGKTIEDWERLAGILVEIDPYDHLRSIHNCMPFYDHSKPWVTHCSIQRQDVYKTAEYTDEWRAKYGKPIVIDECAYEGNINWGWGNITGQELVRRCWEGYVRGGYVGHGETFVDPNDILWWSKGGRLRGESSRRIAFLRRIAEEGPAEGMASISFGWSGWDLPSGGVEKEYYLFYFGFNRPLFRDFSLPPGGEYECEILDTWEMTITKLDGRFSGSFRVALPGKQYMALRAHKVGERAP